jgi:hypothetical protein
MKEKICRFFDGGKIGRIRPEKISRKILSNFRPDNGRISREIKIPPESSKNLSLVPVGFKAFCRREKY